MRSFLEGARSQHRFALHCDILRFRFDYEFVVTLFNTFKAAWPGKRLDSLRGVLDLEFGLNTILDFVICLSAIAVGLTAARSLQKRFKRYSYRYSYRLCLHYWRNAFTKVDPYDKITPCGFCYDLELFFDSVISFCLIFRIALLLEFWYPGGGLTTTSGANGRMWMLPTRLNTLDAESGHFPTHEHVWINMIVVLGIGLTRFEVPWFCLVLAKFSVRLL